MSLYEKYLEEASEKNSSLNLDKEETEQKIKQVSEIKDELDNEKDTLAKERVSLKEKLESIKKEEQEVESREKEVEKREEESKSSEEKKEAAKQRRALEDKRREVEEKRWGYEKRIKEIKEKEEDVRLKYQRLLNEEERVLVVQKKEKFEKEIEKLKEELKDLLQIRARLETEKEDLLDRKEDILKIIEEVSSKEEEIKEEKKEIEEREMAAKDPEEKKKIEQERREIEEKRREIEEERWKHEEDLKKIKDQEKDIDLIIGRENRVRLRIEEIESSLGEKEKIEKIEKIKEESKEKEQKEESKEEEEKREEEKKEEEEEKRKMEEAKKRIEDLRKKMGVSGSKAPDMSIPASEEKTPNVEEEKQPLIQEVDPKIIPDKKDESPSRNLEPLPPQEEKETKELSAKEIREELLKKIKKGKEESIAAPVNEEIRKGVTLKPGMNIEREEDSDISIPKPDLKDISSSHPLPPKPSTLKKMRVRILIFGASILVLLLIALFWYWFFVIRNRTPIVTDPFLEEKILLSDVAFPMDSLRTVNVDNPENIESSLITTLGEWREDEVGSFKKIAIYSPISGIDFEKKEIINIRNFFDAIRIKAPDQFYNLLENEFTLFIYSHPAPVGGRLGFIVKAKDSQGISELMKGIEAGFKNGFKPFFEVMTMEEEYMTFPFRDAAGISGYSGENFRYQTLAEELEICYAIKNDYLIVTSSFESMKEALSRLK